MTMRYFATKIIIKQFNIKFKFILFLYIIVLAFVPIYDVIIFLFLSTYQIRLMIRTLLKKIFAEPQNLSQNRAILINKQARQLALLQPLLSKVDQSLREKNISELVKMQIPEVFNTFATRSINPNVKILNSLTDVNIERALKKNPVGVPFTVKDHLKFQGCVQACGFSDTLVQSDTNCEVMDLLEKEGCIGYGQTSCPQGMLGIQSGGNVYGVSRNPYKKQFISGGSSGGQGAHVASGASVFGISSDSAGSVRIPAAFCGVYGFKPTGGKRLSTKGRLGVFGKQGPPMPGLDASLGYITRNVSDLQWLCQKTLGKSLNQNPLIYNQWSKELFKMSKSKKFRIGFIIQDHEIDVAPAIKNTMNQTIELLKKDGHQVFQFKFPNLHLFRDFFFRIAKVCGFLKGMKSRLGNQKRSLANEQLLSFWLENPIGIKWRILNAGSQIQRSRYQMLNVNMTIQDLFKVQRQKDIVKQQFLNEWNNHKMDLLMTPTMPFTAPLVGTSHHLIAQLNFCAFQNVMQLPAGHIPTRLVQASETKYDDTRFYGSEIKRSIQRSEGLPVGFQLTGRHMQDEVVIGAMWQIQNLMKTKLPSPNL